MNDFNMKILIVDDSKHIHTQLQVFLAAGGYSDMTFVNSGQEAFKYLGVYCNADVINKVDLILMDVGMKDIDGIETTRRIKKLPEFYDIPIIIVTADTSSGTLLRAFEAGAIDYITKPIRKVELLARVKSFLKLKNEIDYRKAREQVWFLQFRLHKMSWSHTQIKLYIWPKIKGETDALLVKIRQVKARILYD